MSDELVDSFAPHVRRNLLCMGSDISFFICGINFTAWSTILPIFVRHLSGSNLVLGLLPAARNIGLNVPPILVSNYVERMSRYKPWVLWVTQLERFPYLIIGISALSFGRGHPTLLLILFFLCQLVASIGGGLTNPAWLHLVSLMIPMRLRGRFFGVSSAIGGLMGIGAAALTVEILRSNRFPDNFAICFLATFAFLMLSFFCLASCHEPPVQQVARRGDRPNLRTYLRSLPDFLRSDHNFAAFLLATVFGNVLMAVAPFIAASASRVLHVSDAEVGAYSVVLLSVSTGGSLCWGWLGDHAGYRVVLICANLAGLATILLALGALASGSAALFFAVFALLGIYNSATQLSSFTIVTEFGSDEDRPTYIALSSLVLAPVALFAPILGGLMADAFGYNAIFVLVATCLATAVCLWLFAVRDPRSHSQFHMTSNNVKTGQSKKP